MRELKNSFCRFADSPLRRITKEQMMMVNKKTVNWYTIWFVLYVLLIDTAFNLYYVFDFGSPATFGTQIVFVLMAAVVAFLLSNIIGLIIAFAGIYHPLLDLWLYWFDVDHWLMKHSHGIGTPGFSFDSFVMVDVIDICLMLVIMLNVALRWLNRTRTRTSL